MEVCELWRRSEMIVLMALRPDGIHPTMVLALSFLGLASEHERHDIGSFAVPS